MKTQITLLVLAGFIYNFGYAQRINVQEARYKHKPIIEMTLNNKKTWVLLDTGTDISILNIKSKDKYGFSTFLKNELKVPGFGSDNNQLHRATNAHLKFGNKQLKNPMFAFDITNIVESIQARTGKRITAIIGTNMMRAYGFVIDMGNGTVVMRYKEKNRLIKNNSLIVTTNDNSAKGK